MNKFEKTFAWETYIYITYVYNIIGIRVLYLNEANMYQYRSNLISCIEKPICFEFKLR